MAINRQLLLALCAPLRHAFCAMELVGDEAKWDAIFASREAELVASGFQWPEGPRWTKSKGLLFSDTISGKMYRWDEATKSAVVFLDDAGGCPKANLVEGYECAAGQAEPGPNGLSREYPYVKKRKPSHNIAVCQHGARRLAFLDLASMKEELIVNKHGRARLNGPNDVVATPDALYFTDPYYALLEKRRPADAQYADDKSELGFAGVYRYDLGTKDLELLDSSLARPNGIGIVNGSHLVVSDCCQGHATDCPAGEARWLVWPFRGDGYLRRGAQVKIVHRDFVKKGCSDGLAFHEASQTLVASCPGGVCLVDLDAGEVVAKMHLGRSVSNVAFGGGYAWVTADKSLWRVELREERRDRRRREL